MSAQAEVMCHLLAFTPVPPMESLWCMRKILSSFHSATLAWQSVSKTRSPFSQFNRNDLNEKCCSLWLGSKSTILVSSSSSFKWALRLLGRRLLCPHSVEQASRCVDCGGGERVGADPTKGWTGEAGHHHIWPPTCHNSPRVFGCSFWHRETLGAVRFPMSHWSTRWVMLLFTVLHAVWTDRSTSVVFVLYVIPFHLVGVIVGSVMAVLIVCVLICIAVFVYVRRPAIIRLVLVLWLVFPP